MDEFLVKHCSSLCLEPRCSVLACLSCSFSCSSERPSDRIPLALHALCSSDTLRPLTPSLAISWNEKGCSYPGTEEAKTLMDLMGLSPKRGLSR